MNLRHMRCKLRLSRDALVIGLQKSIIGFDLQPVIMSDFLVLVVHSLVMVSIIDWFTFKKTAYGHSLSWHINSSTKVTWHNFDELVHQFCWVCGDMISITV